MNKRNDVVKLKEYSSKTNNNMNTFDIFSNNNKKNNKNLVTNNTVNSNNTRLGSNNNAYFEGQYINVKNSCSIFFNTL